MTTALIILACWTSNIMFVGCLMKTMAEIEKAKRTSILWAIATLLILSASVAIHFHGIAYLDSVKSPGTLRSS